MKQQQLSSQRYAMALTLHHHQITKALTLVEQAGILTLRTYKSLQCHKTGNAIKA